MQGFKGSGDLYMDRLTSAGVAQGLIALGNCIKFEILPDAETEDNISRMRDTYGEALDSVTLGKPTTISMTINQYDKDVLAMALMGDVTTQAGAGDTETDEEITAIADKYVELDNREVSSVTVTRKNGDDAGTWVASTAYTVGQYIIPTTPAGRFYKCTTAGTSDSSEPTWPTTTGGTVVDGTVTWTDMGLITASSTTDYSLHTRLGMIKALSTGDIVDGETLNVDYTWSAQDGYDIAGGTNKIIKGRFLLDGINNVNGKKCIVDAKQATVKPSTGIDFLAEGYAELQLEGTLVVPTGESSAFDVDYHE